MPEDLKALFRFARPFRRTLVLAGLLAVGQSVLALIIPWMGGNLAGVVVGVVHPVELRYLLAGLAAVVIGQALLRGASQFCLGRASEAMLSDMRLRIYDHLQGLPLSFHQREARGDVLAHLTTDAGTVSGFLVDYAVGLVPQVITAAGACLIMLTLAPGLGFLGLILLPGYIVLIRLFGRRLRPLAGAIRREEGALLAIAEENLGLIPLIKAFTREPRESARYRAGLEDVQRLYARQRRIRLLLGPVLELTAGLGAVLFVGFGLVLVEENRLAADELVAMLLYVRLLTSPVNMMSGAYGQLQQTRGAMGRLLRVLQEPVESSSAPNRPLRRARGDVRFDGVTFSYPGRPPALREIDLKLAPGKVTVLTGSNGAGKSTLGHLLLRFHDPDAGRVLLDGVDVRQYALHDLRRQIGLVSQHVLLCNGTVRDNIVFGRPDATDDEVFAAARLARAEAFIAALPERYDTWVGEGGIRLSGGQRQRLALARALLKDPPILILDEATSMLDLAGEKALVEGAHSAFEGRAVLLITHRPEALRLADRYVSMEDGMVVFSRSVLRDDSSRSGGAVVVNDGLA